MSLLLNTTTYANTTDMKNYPETNELLALASIPKLIFFSTIPRPQNINITHHHYFKSFSRCNIYIF